MWGGLISACTNVTLSCSLSMLPKHFVQFTCTTSCAIQTWWCPIVAERISARQYKSGSILGIYVCTYVRTYVRSSAQARTSRQVNLNFLPSSSDESDLCSSTSNQMLYCNFAAMLYFDQHQNSTRTAPQPEPELE